MKTTVTEEFDADGTLIKRTTVTDGSPVTGGYVGPFTGGGYPSARCTCGAWSSIMPPPPCPVHGQAQPLTITCSATTTPEHLPQLDVTEHRVDAPAGREHERGWSCVCGAPWMASGNFGEGICLRPVRKLPA